MRSGYDAPALWSRHAGRYAAGEYRAKVCHDLVLSEIAEEGRLRILDIGCGRGFLDDGRLQQSLARRSREYIGIEPDGGVEVGNWVGRVHRATLEDAPIEAGSIDLALSAMVLEHLAEPARFFDKLFQVLREGGVFWGFTVDSRHWFSRASLVAERLCVKRLYLRALHGTCNEKCYKNYRTYYRANSPRELKQLAARFRSCDLFNLPRAGEMDYYLPQRLHWAGRALDRLGHAAGRPGSLLAVRLER